MQGQDWEVVVLRKKTQKITAKTAPLEAKKAGMEVETHKKCTCDVHVQSFPLLLTRAHCFVQLMQA
jgi:hypothetical protein